MRRECLCIDSNRIARMISTMSDELRVYRKYSSFVKCFLLIGGICPIARERSIIYKCISIWSISSCFVLLFTIGNFCLQNVGNISLLTSSFTVFVTTLNVILKACCFSIYQKKLQKVNHVLDSLLEEALNKNKRHVRSKTFFCLKAFYWLIYAQTVLMTTTVIIYLTKPVIIKILYDTNNGNNTTNVQYPLPISGTNLWTIDSTLVWQLYYLFDMNVIWFILCISTGVDAFFGFCMFRMSAVLHLLGSEFETRFSYDEKNKKNQKYDRRIFNKCVDQHVFLMKCRDVVQEAYGFPILLVTVTNAIGMCTLIFQTFQVSGASVDQITVLVTYLFVKLIQTFLYAWPGDVVLTESELFRHKVYFSGWYKNKNTSFAKLFSLVLVQKPIILKACNLMQISLDLFVKILNTTISYYFLLETFDNDE